MGCTPSVPSCKKSGVRLTATKLAFSKTQLNNLNPYFRKLIDENRNDYAGAVSVDVETVVERLLQRLTLVVSDLDRRFSSTFLVSLNEPRRAKQLKFEYLLRIDALSSPGTDPAAGTTRVSVEEDASLPGFIRLKLPGAGAELWREYTDAAGRLRRDLVKAKLANLLAAAIKREDPVSEEDRFSSASPGQVVDAEVLDKILKQPDHCRIFYGSAVADGPLPEPRNHRVALIEDAGGILLRIGADGFRAREIEVRLLIGIGISSWPSLADYPRRIPLHHCDALLHYNAAQSGMYAVAVGPHPGARCVNRATLWWTRVPAAEKIMSQHRAVCSVPALTESTLLEILYQLRDGCSLNLSTRRRVAEKRCAQNRLRVVSRHILRTLWRWSLERTGPDPLMSWSPDTLSRHVLFILDELVDALRRRNLRCYLHPRCNLMLQCARGGAVHHEDSFDSDSRLLECYLETLHRQSLSMTPEVPRPLDVLENELILRWRGIAASLPRGNAAEDYGCGPRQLEYLGLIVEEALRARDTVPQKPAENHDNSYHTDFTEPRTADRAEDLVYMLRLVLTQARDQARSSCRRSRIPCRGRGSRRRRNFNGGSRFDCSVELLADVVRKDRESVHVDQGGPLSSAVLAKVLLQWLYFAMDYDRKVLEPILWPYLCNLRDSLREYSWCAGPWKREREIYASEMRSLSSFCKSVISREISPAEGILDRLSAGSRWAENTTRMIERSGNSLRLILLSGDREFRCVLTFSGNRGPSSFSAWSKARSVAAIARRGTINYSGELFDCLSKLRAVTDERKGVARHAELRDTSPLTYVASLRRSRARHRGPGDLITAMLSLGKFTVLQEVAARLPREEQAIMLNTVYRAARESSRRFRKAISSSATPTQIYRPRPETDAVDSSPRSTAEVRERCIIAEHQRQLEKEMREIYDTLRMSSLPRQRVSLWESNSLSSWSSSVDSVAGTVPRSVAAKKHRAPIWELVERSPSAVPRDVGHTEKNKFSEMISREESPVWSALDARRKFEDPESRNGDELPSWDILEASLNRRLCNYADALPRSPGTEAGTGRNCATSEK